MKPWMLAYAAAAVAEIAGCYAFWAWLKLDRSPLWLLPGMTSLAVFAWLLTFVPSEAAGRAFAAYGGVNARPLVLGSMFFSGSIAGAVGLVIVLGSHYRLIDGAIVQTNYAWPALLVALLAWRGSLALVVTGFAFAALLVAGAALQRSAGVSAQIAPVLQALIILIVSLRVFLPKVNLTRKQRQEVEA